MYAYGYTFSSRKKKEKYYFLEEVKAEETYLSPLRTPPESHADASLTFVSRRFSSKKF